LHRRSSVINLIYPEQKFFPWTENRKQFSLIWSLGNYILKSKMVCLGLSQSARWRWKPENLSSIKISTKMGNDKEFCFPQAERLCKLQC